MNQQLAALDIYTIVYEIQDLVGSYIDKIYQLSPDEIIIRVNNRTTKQKEILYVHSNGLFFRTRKSFETPMKPSTFAMTLRKHISNGRIVEINQHGFDRIIKIKIQKKEEYSLLFELIPNGNMMLLNHDQKIIMPLKHQHWSERSIRTNTLYQPPPSQINPFSISPKEIKSLLQKSDADLVRTIAVKLSLGGKYAEEFCAHLDIPKTTPAAKLGNEQYEQVYTQLHIFLKQFEQYQFSPQIIFLDTTKEVIPFPFIIYKNEDSESVSTFSQGLEKIFTPSSVQTDSFPLGKKKEKLLRQKNQQEKAILEFDNQIQQKKRQGDLIYLHYSTIEQLISEIQNNRKLFTKKELSEVLNDKEIVKEFSPDSPLLTLKLPDERKQIIEVQIDYRKSVSENAERSYDKSKKLVQKKQGAIKALQQTKQQIEKIDQQVEKQVQQQKEEKKKKKVPQKDFWFEQYRWCIANNGNLILGGKDAKSNDQLIKKHLENGDRYAHADIHGAPSCIIKNKNIDNKIISIPNDALQEACTFSACYSRAWKQFAEVQAYWVLPEQVSKTPQSGEFVPKGAFIIRGKRNYCNCKMQLGIGIIYILNSEKVMGGPISLIKKWCKSYVIIEPGTIKSSTIAKEIADYLDVNPSVVQQVLPPGESRLISKINKKK
jgi:predicted ribosome quality control (RQC) complex YloA/Tae2 family protein